MPQDVEASDGEGGEGGEGGEELALTPEPSFLQ